METLNGALELQMTSIPSCIPTTSGSQPSTVLPIHAVMRLSWKLHPDMRPQGRNPGTPSTSMGHNLSGSPNIAQKCSLPFPKSVPFPGPARAALRKGPVLTCTLMVSTAQHIVYTTSECFVSASYSFLGCYHTVQHAGLTQPMAAHPSLCVTVVQLLMEMLSNSWGPDTRGKEAMHYCTLHTSLNISCCQKRHPWQLLPWGAHWA